MLPMMIRDIILLLMIIFGLSFGNIKGKWLMGHYLDLV
jgi:hypothetical protein